MQQTSENANKYTKVTRTGQSIYNSLLSLSYLTAIFAHIYAVANLTMNLVENLQWKTKLSLPKFMVGF